MVVKVKRYQRLLEKKKLMIIWCKLSDYHMKLNFIVHINLIKYIYLSENIIFIFI